MVYRGEVKASAQQMRAAIESLPYESPKLPARVQVTTDFGYQLDAPSRPAIAQS